MTLQIKPYGSRPTFAVEETAPIIELEDNQGVVLKDSLYHCKEHLKQVCVECNFDYSLQNFLTRQMEHNGTGVPIPSEEIQKKIQELKTQGNSFFRTKNFEQAAAKYTQALACCNQRPPWDPASIISEESSVLYCNRAACFLEMGKYAEALWETEVVIRLKRTWGKAHYRRGKAYLMLGRYKEAAESLEFALVYGADNAETRKALKEAKAML
ncbi:hypothetical protein BB560_003600 [Smittium megazygosporum]|uniref:Uncharacterized protein n=1 Tax=Smittium megazygosporum TaxID=133381 RepID=A0A2T9ZBJ2_9FUNG|nr:hypothetical protein BB560_003600 [Smittium megazygosporum]